MSELDASRPASRPPIAGISRRRRRRSTPPGSCSAIVAAHPRRRTDVWPWALRPAPALVWLVLLALLLAALGAGALFVGSQLQRKLPAVVPPVGPAFACPPGSNARQAGAGRPGPAGRRRRTMAFDRRAGRLVAVASAGNGVETWTFDVCTNTWTQDASEPGAAELRMAQLVYDVDSDVTILVSNDSDWATREECGPTTSRPTPGPRRGLHRRATRCPWPTTPSPASSSPRNTPIAS